MCRRFVPLSVFLWRVFIALQMLICVNVYITNWTAFKWPPFAFQLHIHFASTYACFITNVGLVMSGGSSVWLCIIHRNACSCSIHTGLSFGLLHVSVLRFENCTAGSLLVLLGWTLNLLKPTGYVVHQQFNIQQLYALPTLYLCVLFFSENKQRLVPLTA